MSNKIGRNESCPCGSGKKFKKCHYLKKEIKQRRRLIKSPTLAHKDLIRFIRTEKIKGL